MTIDVSKFIGEFAPKKKVMSREEKLKSRRQYRKRYEKENPEKINLWTKKKQEKRKYIRRTATASCTECGKEYFTFRKRLTLCEKCTKKHLVEYQNKYNNKYYKEIGKFYYKRKKDEPRET